MALLHEAALSLAPIGPQLKENRGATGVVPTLALDVKETIERDRKRMRRDISVAPLSPTKSRAC